MQTNFVKEKENFVIVNICERTEIYIFPSSHIFFFDHFPLRAPKIFLFSFFFKQNVIF